jgi:hypothetical protein
VSEEAESSKVSKEEEEELFKAQAGGRGGGVTGRVDSM